MDPFLSRQLLITLIEWMGVIALTLIISLSPVLQRKRPVIFQYPRREGLVSLGLYAALLLLTTAIYAALRSAQGAPPLPPGTQPATFTYTTDELVQQIGLSLGLALPFVLALRVRRQPWLSAGLGRANLRGGLQLGMALTLVTIFLAGKVYAILDGVSAPQMLFLPAMAVSALVEEFIFRGYIQLRLMGWLGETRGWIVTAALFALWRIPQRIFVQGLNDWLEFGVSLLLLFGLGLVLGWVMRKSGSILASGIYHAIHNWIQVL